MKETYKQQIEREVYNLMCSALGLANILDQRINEHGMITVSYQFASEIIHQLQQSAKRAADELEFIASGYADIEELYPNLKGGEK